MDLFKSLANSIVEPLARRTMRKHGTKWEETDQYVRDIYFMDASRKLIAPALACILVLSTLVGVLGVFTPAKPPLEIIDSKWNHGGLEQVVRTAREHGESRQEWMRRHKVAIEDGRKLFPPD